MMNVWCQHKLRKFKFKVYAFPAVTEALVIAKTVPLSSVLIILWQFIAFHPRNSQMALATLAHLQIAEPDLNSCHLSPSLIMESLVVVTTKYPLLRNASGHSRNCLPFYTRNVLVLSFNNITFHCYADDTQPNLSFPSGNTQCEAFICWCHVDIFEWMSAHHLKLSLDKSEWFFFQACFCPL